MTALALLLLCIILALLLAYVMGRSRWLAGTVVALYLAFGAEAGLKLIGPFLVHPFMRF